MVNKLFLKKTNSNQAQIALNNCVLGNTTIFAESPGESDVATMLNSLGHSQPQAGPQGSSQNWNLRAQAPPLKQPSVSDTWAASGGKEKKKKKKFFYFIPPLSFF